MFPAPSSAKLRRDGIRGKKVLAVAKVRALRMGPWLAALPLACGCARVTESAKPEAASSAGAAREHSQADAAAPVAESAGAPAIDLGDTARPSKHASDAGAGPRPR